MVCHIKKMTKPGHDFSRSLFTEHFSALKDPRRTSKGNLLYPLEEILFLTISASVCGCTSWLSIEHFGKVKIDWLRKFFKYSNGIPSHDAISDLTETR
jgi:hypothetical protein